VRRARRAGPRGRPRRGVRRRPRAGGTQRLKRRVADAVVVSTLSLRSSVTT
jgi:hypothetical protein